MGHELQDRSSLEMARRIAAGLDRHPEWIELARENLRRWKAANAASPRLLACYEAWSSLLDRPLHEVVAMLLREDDLGQQYRQNSPFAGALAPAEVWEIKRRVRESATR